ncbi:MAG TPA: Xaa-Pro peptidase family protein [Gaiellaceae bacterium]|nr:Xaa-Pro peptidase family protein [Gaiellaceae bacterium]
MRSRIEAVAHHLDAPLLVTNLTNVRYLTGFESSNAAILIKPDGDATLWTDFRYIEEARKAQGVTVEMVARNLLKDIAPDLGSVQFEADALPYAQWQVLDGEGVKLTPTRGIVEELRAVKDDGELEAIRRAVRAADHAFEALTAEAWVGRTEREIAWRFQELMHAHGADTISFEPIVAAGPNGAKPHADPSDRIVEADTLVVVDFGVKLDGYCSDCTRTVTTGKIPNRMREIYDVCLAAQTAAVAGIRPTMTGVEADKIARSIIEEAGYGAEFGHGLGHGIGLDVHEAPRLSTESSDTLQTGNVITVEPGIYVEGYAGVRIEDLVIVTDDGVEIVSSFPKTLVELS